MPPGRLLDPVEQRVLGVLLEKEQTTPDQYPLTINATITACNQKTNRDPVTSLTETEVVEALDRLRLDVLAWRSEGARVERWQHSVERRWHLSGARKAVLTVLLLRGAQTPGELKTRTERMHSFADTDEVEKALEELAEGAEGLVEQLPRRPGQRETRWDHLLYAERPQRQHDAPDERTPATATAGSAGPEGRPAATPRPSGSNGNHDVVQLREEVRELRDQLGDLRALVDDLRSQLGLV